MVVFNMMVGLVLPPHGLLLFIMSGLLETSIAQVYQEVLVFVAVMLIVLVAVTFLPDLVLWLPRALGSAPS